MIPPLPPPHLPTIESLRAELAGCAETRHVLGNKLFLVRGCLELLVLAVERGDAKALAKQLALAKELIEKKVSVR